MTNWETRAAERRAVIARYRVAFAEAYQAKRIYAIEYVYRAYGWTYPDKRGRCEPRTAILGHELNFFTTRITKTGVMLAVRDGDGLLFGFSACHPTDKWSKYIGLGLALERVNDPRGFGFSDGGEGLVPGFIARQTARLVARR